MKDEARISDLEEALDARRHESYTMAALLEKGEERINALEVSLSEMRRERDASRAEARQWRADCRKAQHEVLDAMRDARNDALREAAEAVSQTEYKIAAPAILALIKVKQ